MASVLSDLRGAADKDKEDFDVFQQGVEQNKVAAENLLSNGRTSGKVPPLSTGVFKLGVENDVHAPTKCLYMHIQISVHLFLDALLMPPDFLSTEQLDCGRGPDYIIVICKNTF